MVLRKGNQLMAGAKVCKGKGQCEGGQATSPSTQVSRPFLRRGRHHDREEYDAVCQGTGQSQGWPASFCQKQPKEPGDKTLCEGLVK